MEAYPNGWSLSRGYPAIGAYQFNFTRKHRRVADAISEPRHRESACGSVGSCRRSGRIHLTPAGHGTHDGGASKDLRLKRSIQKQSALAQCNRGGDVTASEKACTLGPNLQLISLGRVLSVRVSRMPAFITSRKHSVSEGGPRPTCA